MERRKASDFPQGLLDLFDLYVHGDIDRRSFLDGAQRYATGAVTAAMLWESLRPNYAWAQQVPPDDPRIRAERVDVESPQGNGRIRCYLVRPAKAQGKLPGVVVIHENRGLNPYIEDVARRLAAEGFLALAPDGLTSAGGYPGDDEKGVQLFRGVDRQKLNEDFIAAARWLRKHPDCTGKIGAVGFCYGGGVANMLAVRLGEELAAAVPFYGGQPPAAEVPKIRAALMLHYAGLDKRVNEGWPAYEAALKEHGKEYQAFFTKTPTTASTTTQPRATTKPRRSSPGREPWRFSGKSSDKHGGISRQPEPISEEDAARRAPAAQPGPAQPIRLCQSS